MLLMLLCMLYAYSQRINTIKPKNMKDELSKQFRSAGVFKYALFQKGSLMTFVVNLGIFLRHSLKVVFARVCKTVNVHKRETFGNISPGECERDQRGGACSCGPSRACSHPPGEAIWCERSMRSLSRAGAKQRREGQKSKLGHD